MFTNNKFNSYSILKNDHNFNSFIFITLNQQRLHYDYDDQNKNAQETHLTHVIVSRRRICFAHIHFCNKYLPTDDLLSKLSKLFELCTAFFASVELNPFSGAIAFPFYEN